MGRGRRPPQRSYGPRQGFGDRTRGATVRGQRQDAGRAPGCRAREAVRGTPGARGCVETDERRLFPAGLRIRRKARIWHCRPAGPESATSCNPRYPEFSSCLSGPFVMPVAPLVANCVDLPVSGENHAKSESSDAPVAAVCAIQRPLSCLRVRLPELGDAAPVLCPLHCARNQTCGTCARTMPVECLAATTKRACVCLRAPEPTQGPPATEMGHPAKHQPQRNDDPSRTCH